MSLIKLVLFNKTLNTKVEFTCQRFVVIENEIVLQYMTSGISDSRLSCDHYKIVSVEVIQWE